MIKNKRLRMTTIRKRLKVQIIKKAMKAIGTKMKKKERLTTLMKSIKADAKEAMSLTERIG